MITRFLAIAMAGLAACTPLADRVAVTQLPSTLELRPLVGSAMVRTVSLPTYAAVEEIPFETESGIIAVREDVLWADDPERAVTLIITQTLSDILNTDVGPDPWPFVGLPDVSIDVRVAQMLGNVDGTYTLAGQFFVAGEATRFRNSTNDFAITVDLPNGSPSAIAEAQSAAILQLSEQIARTLGR